MTNLNCLSYAKWIELNGMTKGVPGLKAYRDYLLLELIEDVSTQQLMKDRFHVLDAKYANLSDIPLKGLVKEQINTILAKDRYFILLRTWEKNAQNKAKLTTKSEQPSSIQLAITPTPVNISRRQVSVTFDGVNNSVARPKLLLQTTRHSSCTLLRPYIPEPVLKGCGHKISSGKRNSHILCSKSLSVHLKAILSDKPGLSIEEIHDLLPYYSYEAIYDEVFSCDYIVCKNGITYLVDPSVTSSSFFLINNLRENND